MALLQADPQSFAEFHTVDELAAIRNSLGSDDLVDIPNEYIEENVFDNHQEYVDDGWSSIKSKKTNFENVGKETYNEKDLSQSSNCKKKKESNKKSEFQFPEHEENQEWTDENKFESIKSKKFKNKNEKTEFHLPKIDFGLSTTKMNSETIVAVESKSQKEVDSNVTKTIDLFGGWGSKTSESINLKVTKKREVSAESNVNSLRNTDIKDVKISKQKENLKLPKTFPDIENFANEKDDAYCKKENFTDRWDNFRESEYSFSSIQNTASMPHTDSWGNVNNSDETLNRYVQSSISVSDSTPSYTMVENSSEMNEKRFHGLSDTNFFGDQKLNNTSKNDDFLVNSIVKDYANLAVKCADNFAKEKVPIHEETKNTCINLTTALKNIKQTEYDLGQLKPPDPFHNINQNALLNKTLTNETCKSKITYSLNNSQVNLPATTSSESSKFFNNPETFSPFMENSMNNKFSLPLINDTAKAAASSQEIHSVDGNIPAPVQPQLSFPYQPMPMMSNAINPEVMMNMNPLIIQQQMMVLHNPFFFQQLQQMNMYYRTMGGMPFMTGLVPPVPMVPVSPVFNNPVCTLPNNELMRNVNQVDQLQTDEDSFIPPPYQKLQEKEELNDVPSLLYKSTSEYSKTPSLKFENAWLTDILSEGATVIDPDSFIPPPVPATNLSSVVYGQSTTTSAPTFNCDTRNIKVAKADYKNKNVNNGLASNENPNYVESNETGWGNIEAPSQNYSSWNNTTDGWGN
ncbi:uncharacterized protein CEXT_630931 [Caerostris extrusa]|uniref:Uncharacterized protein n=1 Tax=Caerostris extrusa TaxID=172846 RepID=A0AAV4Q8A2_CAEEX|nr:uncharacterized protein CEXT_630931 [Caerostris extrusa]